VRGGCDLGLIFIVKAVTGSLDLLEVIVIRALDL
jgi:hypothetical protein